MSCEDKTHTHFVRRDSRSGKLRSYCVECGRAAHLRRMAADNQKLRRVTQAEIDARKNEHDGPRAKEG